MGLEFTITLTCIYCKYTINTALYIQIRHTIQIQNGITSLTVLEILCFHFLFIFHSLHFPVPFYFMFPIAQLCFTSCHCFGNTHNNHHQLARNHPAITTVIFRVPTSSVLSPMRHHQFHSCSYLQPPPASISGCRSALSFIFHGIFQKKIVIFHQPFLSHLA